MKKDLKYILTIGTSLLIACGIKNNSVTQDKHLVHIYTIDKQISTLRYEIDSIYKNKSEKANDSLMQHTSYKYFAQNHAKIDSLIKQNQQLLRTAYKAVSNYASVSIVKCDESVFSFAEEIETVRKIAPQYYASKRKIANFKKMEADANILEQLIQNYFDQQSIKQISNNQLKIDSLLNAKITLVNE